MNAMMTTMKHSHGSSLLFLSSPDILFLPDISVKANVTQSANKDYYSVAKLDVPVAPVNQSKNVDYHRAEPVIPVRILSIVRHEHISNDCTTMR